MSIKFDPEDQHWKLLLTIIDSKLPTLQKGLLIRAIDVQFGDIDYIDLLSIETARFVATLDHRSNFVYNFLNRVILPHGPADLISQFDDDDMDLYFLPKIIATTNEEWRKEKCLDIINRNIPDLEREEREELYLSFVRQNLDPNSYPISWGELDIDTNLLLKIKCATQALGTNNKVFPPNITYLKVKMGGTIYTFEDGKLTLSDGTDRKEVIKISAWIRNIYTRSLFDNGYRYENFYEDMLNGQYDSLEFR